MKVNLVLKIPSKIKILEFYKLLEEKKKIL